MDSLSSGLGWAGFAKDGGAAHTVVRTLSFWHITLIRKCSRCPRLKETGPSCEIGKTAADEA
jgi:hypothetical protein